MMARQNSKHHIITFFVVDCPVEPRSMLRLEEGASARREDYLTIKNCYILIHRGTINVTKSKLLLIFHTYTQLACGGI